MIDFEIHLDWKITETPQHRMLKIGALIIIKIENSYEIEVRGDSFSHNDEGLPSCTNPETRLTTHMELWSIIYLNFEF